MKKFWLLVAIAATTLTWSGCTQDCDRQITYTKFSPVYKTAEEMQGTIQGESPRAFRNPGKIFVKGETIFITEFQEGVHVIDNSNPSAPVKNGFIKIPGCIDVTVQGNTLFADNYKDLVSVDISNIQQPREIDRKADVFASMYVLAPDGRYIVAYTSDEVTETMKCGEIPAQMRNFNDSWVLFSGPTPSASMETAFAGSASGTTSGTGRGAVSSGVAGSMSRFAIKDNYLYALDQNSLLSFEIQSNGALSQGTTSNGFWNVETIFVSKDYLFIGSNSGMIVYKTDNPMQPTLISQFSHATGCDPVIVDERGENAYLTIHSGTSCNGTANTLEAINVRDIYAPQTIRNYPMKRPQGLALDGELLYLCDDTEGVKVLNVANPADIRLVKTITGIQARDIVIQNNSLMVIATDGLYQYSNDLSNSQLLSRIVVK